MTKREAVYRIVEILGMDASAEEIRDYGNKHFGIQEMSLSHISNTKGEIRRAQKEAGQGAPTPAAHEPAKEQAPTNGETVPLKDDILALQQMVDRIGPEAIRALLLVMGK